MRDSIAGANVAFTIFIPLERFCAICNPFFYSNLTKRHAVLSIILVCLFPIIFTVWRIFSMDVFVAAFVVTFVGSLVVTLSNLHLYRSVRKQCADIASQIVAKTREGQLEKRLCVEKRKLRALRMCIAFTISYMLTWVPVGIKTMVKILLGIKERRTYMDAVIGIIGFTNGIWDVLIFFYVSKSAKEHIKKLFKANRGEQNLKL